MPWIKKECQCDWCEAEINALIDEVFESEKGTLCAKCEKARVEERVLYQEERNRARVSIEVQRAVKDVINDGKPAEEDQEVAEAGYVAEFCTKCGQELPDGEGEDDLEGIN